MKLYLVIIKNLYRLPRIIRKMRRLADKEPFAEREAYAYLRKVVRMINRSAHVRTEVFGTENLPKEGGYIMYPNHQGKYDGYAIVHAHETPCSVVMDKRKSRFPFISEVIDMVRGKRMELDNMKQSLQIINEVAREAEQGRRFIIFPEGGYTSDKKNTLTEFKKGCFKASLKSRTPIVPIVLVDTHKVLNGNHFGSVKAQVHILPPIYYEEFGNMKTGEIAQLVYNRIQDKLNEIQK